MKFDLSIFILTKEVAVKDKYQFQQVLSFFSNKVKKKEKEKKKESVLHPYLSQGASQ